MTSRLGRLVFALAALLVAAAPARAQTSLGGQRVGTSAGTFLKIGVGARAVGMGEAFVAVANDPSTIYWNPAGLAGLQRKEFTASHTDWPADVSYDFVAAVIPVEKFGGSFGIQLASLRTDLQETDEDHPYGTGRTFQYTDFVGGLSYARRFTDKLLIGFTGKYIHENLGLEVGGSTVNSWLVDVGSIYYIGLGSLRIGVTLANFGPDFKPSGLFYSPNGLGTRDYDSFNPPTQFRYGVAMEPYENKDVRLTTSVEVSQPADNQQELKGGIETTFERTISLRAGYNVNADELKWSAGAGVVGDISTLRGTVDYAYTDGGLLGSVHRLSVGVRF